MNEVSFVEKREPDWRRLAHLTDRADIGPRNLTHEELREFVRLYRRTSSDLALVRTQSSNLQLIDFLNDLVGRAYVSLYRSPRGSFWKALGMAVISYARTVRKLKVFVFASMGMFLLGCVGAYGLMTVRPDLRDQFVPAQAESTFKEWRNGTMEERTGSESLIMTSFYSANNPLVAAATGAAAVGTFGVVATQHLFTNGAMLGALAKDLSEVGRFWYLIVRVTPHGVTEMSGLIFAGAGGYAMAWALINPGRRKRSEALMEAGKDALIVYIGGVCLMFIAAPIEGFFSFNPRVPEWVKAIFAITSLVAWITFYTQVGKEPEPVHAE